MKRVRRTVMRLPKSGRLAGDYLRQPSGTFTNNLLRLTAHNLSSALATALHKAEKQSGNFTYDNVRLRVREESRVLRLRIKTVSFGVRGVVSPKKMRASTTSRWAWAQITSRSASGRSSRPGAPSANGFGRSCPHLRHHEPTNETRQIRAPSIH